CLGLRPVVALRLLEYVLVRVVRLAEETQDGDLLDGRKADDVDPESERRRLQRDVELVAREDSCPGLALAATDPQDFAERVTRLRPEHDDRARNPPHRA